MPVFDYLCPCGKKFERFLKAANVAEQQYCECGKTAEKQLSCCNVYVMQSYQSPVTGQWIDSPNQRKKDLAESGSRPWEGKEIETQMAQGREKEFDSMLDKSAEKAATTAFHDLPLATRKVLTSGEAAHE
jgi:hypothetical protein